ncbi:hypothetical protein BZA77DRAFT_325472 [Pyronema omphalodes]|nr:hypothetical protein BZA77DRAFT_325472 [Pyronema omphalodes]
MFLPSSTLEIPPFFFSLFFISFLSSRYLILPAYAGCNYHFCFSLLAFLAVFLLL